MNFSRTSLAALVVCSAAIARSSAAPTPANSSVSGDFSTRPNGGFRLEANARGPAHVQSPELDVRARVLEIDRPGKTISQVRAVGSVAFKLDLTPRGGGAPAHIEANCDGATLTTADRKLVLQGHLNGFYQLAGGARNTLSGDGATLRYVGQNLLADLSGGVTLKIPAETFGRPDDLGDVTITAQRAQINQGDGTATFAGQARAVSSGGAAPGGPRGFDVSAARFTLTRTPDGTISRLVTGGRTLVKLDLPPEPVTTGTASGAATDAKPTDAKTFGTPSHVEVAADSAVIERATSTATLEGNVRGFYRLTQGGVPENYDFSGTRAVIRSLPGFDLHVSDAIVGGPPFDLGL